jgi:hypothetical protein
MLYCAILAVAVSKGMTMMIAEELKAGIERKYPAVAQSLWQELALATELQSDLLPPTPALTAKGD